MIDGEGFELYGNLWTSRGAGAGGQAYGQLTMSRSWP